MGRQALRRPCWSKLSLLSPLPCVSITSSLRESLHGMERWGKLLQAGTGQLCVHELPGPGTSPKGSTFQLDKLRQVTKPPQPQFLSPRMGTWSTCILGCWHSLRLYSELVPRLAAGRGHPQGRGCHQEEARCLPHPHPVDHMLSPHRPGTPRPQRPGRGT